MWEVANGKILVLLVTCWQIIKPYSSKKLERSNLFRLYFIEKIFKGVLMEKYLREVIGK